MYEFSDEAKIKDAFNMSCRKCGGKEVEISIVESIIDFDDSTPGTITFTCSDCLKNSLSVTI